MHHGLILKKVANRPVTSFGLGFAGLVSGTAVATEYRATHQENIVLEGEKGFNVTNIPLLPRTYDRKAVRDYWVLRPVSVMKRLAHVVYELAPIAGCYIRNFKLTKPASLQEEQVLLQEQAVALREALTNLGPAWVKGGQQIAIRLDLVPPVVLKELQALGDSVRPISDKVALQIIRDELKLSNLDSVFEDLNMVAAASIGQVYKTKIIATGETVAIKVQRPGMRKNFSLDLFLLQKWGDFMDTFTSIFTQQKPFHAELFDSFSRGSYSELDYENEARNQIHFKKELAIRNSKVHVPQVFEKFTSERVITTEWIDGVKLADSPKDQIRQLIPVGVDLFLTQLLDIGAFHADPHPGNLLVTRKGELCLLDFGLCAEIDSKSRVAMTKAIIHLLQRDFDSLISEDAKELGFLPDDFDTHDLKPILKKVLTVGLVETGSNLRQRTRKLQEISNELNDIFFRYPFQVPPFFALVTRGLGLLEGIALTGDPDFDIFVASAPFASKRAMRILGSHHANYMRQRITTSRRRTRTSSVRI